MNPGLVLSQAELTAPVKAFSLVSAYVTELG